MALLLGVGNLTGLMQRETTNYTTPQLALAALMPPLMPGETGVLISVTATDGTPTLYWKTANGLYSVPISESLTT